MGEFQLTPSEIVATSRQLVVEGGPDALTVRRLASSLFCAPPAIYRRIGDKATLCQMLCDDIVDSAMEAIRSTTGPGREANPSLPGSDRLLDWWQQNPNLTAFYLREATSRPMPAPDVLVDWVASSDNVVTDPETATNLAMGAIARLSALHPPDTPDFRAGAATVLGLVVAQHDTDPIAPETAEPAVNLKGSQHRRAVSTEAPIDR